MFSLDFSALRKRKVMEATRRSSTCTGPTEDFMSTVSVSTPDPLDQKLGCCLGCSLPGVLPRKFVVMWMSWDLIVSNDSTLNGGGEAGNLSYWRSLQIGGTLLFDSTNAFSVLTTPWAQSFTAVLQLMFLPLRVRIVVSNMFKLCSPVGSDLIGKFKSKLPTFHRIGPSEGICICRTAVWLVVSLHNNEIRLLSNSLSGCSWLQECQSFILANDILATARIPHAVQDVFDCQIRPSFVGNCFGGSYPSMQMAWFFRILRYESICLSQSLSAAFSLSNHPSRRETSFAGRWMENAAVVKVVQRCLADVTRNPARILEAFEDS